MDYLRELYLGKIFPADSNTFQNPAYRDAARRYTQHYDALKESAPPEMLEELKKMTDMHDLLLTIQDEEAFKLGFRLGVQMMCACFNTNRSDGKP